MPDNSNPMTEPQSAISNRTMWISLVSAFIARAIYIFNTGIVPDEAYYWDWSRSLSFGYFDHPPATAWLAYLTTRLFGNTITGIKSGPLAVSFLYSLFSCLLLKKYCRRTSSILFLIVLLNGTVIYSIGTLLLIPDTPQILFWSLGMLLGYRAIFERSRISWPLMGVAAGFGLLSKYVFMLFFLSTGLFLLFSREKRALLKSSGPYEALAAAILVFSPNLIWNHRHEWISFLFQLKHGLQSKSWLRIDLFGEYLGGQIGVVSPFLFILLIIICIVVLKKYKDDSRLIYLFTFFAVPLAFFGVSSLSKRVEANWPSPAYISGFILLAWFWETLRPGTNKKMRGYTLFSASFSFILTLIIHAHILRPFLPIPAFYDITKQSRGWIRFGEDLNKVREIADPGQDMPVCANRFQETAMAAFYLPDQPRTYSLDICSRKNHYSFLKSRESIFRGPVVFFHRQIDGKLEQYIADRFDNLRFYGTIYLYQPPADGIPFGVYTGIFKETE